MHNGLLYAGQRTTNNSFWRQFVGGLFLKHNNFICHIKVEFNTEIWRLFLSATGPEVAWLRYVYFVQNFGTRLHVIPPAGVLGYLVVTNRYMVRTVSKALQSLCANNTSKKQGYLSIHTNYCVDIGPKQLFLGKVQGRHLVPLKYVYNVYRAYD